VINADGENSRLEKEIEEAARHLRFNQEYRHMLNKLTDNLTRFVPQNLNIRRDCSGLLSNMHDYIRLSLESDSHFRCEEILETINSECDSTNLDDILDLVNVDVGIDQKLANLKQVADLKLNSDYYRNVKSM
jgi:hypothetical protein